MQIRKGDFMNGKLITFEGGEGAGKTTQAKELTKWLQESVGVKVITTREPGGTPTGEVIRQLLQHDLSGEPLCDATEALLFCASRAQLCKNVLAPALNEGTWVVLDRFTDSTLAYQGYGRGFNVEQLRNINDFATGEVKPDLTILIDISLEVGFSRISRRGDGTKDRIEQAPLEFHRRLHDGYLEMAAREPERFVIVDGSQPPEKVQEDIRNIVRTRFGIEV